MGIRHEPSLVDLDALGVELTELTKEQAEYIGVDVDGVRVRFRPAGTARKLRKGGAVPKWEDLKMKTINDDDILLGAPKAGKSQPGYFKPKMPDAALKTKDPAAYERRRIHLPMGRLAEARETRRGGQR